MPTAQPEKTHEPPTPPKKNQLELDDVPPPIIEAEGEGTAETQTGGESQSENEGEGNRTADQNYRRGVKKHLEEKNVEQEAEEAADALDDDEERQELEDAEEAARRGRIH